MPSKILVIDDEPYLVEMIANRLRTNRYETATAVSGKEGFRKAQSEKPDLILLDILMLDMDGYQVLLELKRDALTKAIPVVMLTVKNWSEDVQKALAAGAVDYLVKPFDPEKLLEKIEAVLNAGRSHG